MRNPLVIIALLLFVIFFLGPTLRARKKKRGRSRTTRKKRKSSRSKRKRSRRTGTIKIYKLMDGRRAFYVGQTRQTLQQRLRQHILDDSGNDKSWHIYRMKREPTIKLICTTRSQSKADELENKYMRRWGRTNMKRA